MWWNIRTMKWLESMTLFLSILCHHRNVFYSQCKCFTIFRLMICSQSSYHKDTQRVLAKIILFTRSMTQSRYAIILCQKVQASLPYIFNKNAEPFLLFKRFSDSACDAGMIWLQIMLYNFQDEIKYCNFWIFEKSKFLSNM